MSTAQFDDTVYKRNVRSKYRNNISITFDGKECVNGKADEINAVEAISCRLTAVPSLSSYKHVQFLFLRDNAITEITTLPATLILLDCGQNKIKSIKNIPSTLVELLIDSNELETFPNVDSASLKILQCYDNPKLTKIPSDIGSTLITLRLSTEQIKHTRSIDTNDKRRLDISIYCGRNQIDSEITSKIERDIGKVTDAFAKRLPTYKNAKGRVFNYYDLFRAYLLTHLQKNNVTFDEQTAHDFHIEESTSHKQRFEKGINQQLALHVAGK